MVTAEAQQAPEQLQGAASAATDCQQGQIRHFNWDQRAQARACMQTLVMALADDPVNNYFSGSKRRKFVKDEVKGYLKALPDATNFIATPDSMAVALWQLMPHETPRNELWAGWTRILKVPPRLWRQLLRLELHYEKAHTKVAADFGSYYYLSFIGTRPETRGKGYGSLLLKHITDRADTEGRWCLLEATSERSQALYARHGFVTYEAYRVSPAAPPVFLMKRAPAGNSTAAAATATAAAAAAVAPTTTTTTALSAAALDLVAAVSGKTRSAPTSPGSECGSVASSSLIGASVVIEEGPAGGDDGDAKDLLKLQQLLHVTEQDEEAGAAAEDCCDGQAGKEVEEEQQEAGVWPSVRLAGLVSGPVDGGVIIRSSSSMLNLKEAGEAAAAGGVGSGVETGAGCEGGSSNQQPVCSGSSSSAGAGGPSDVTC